MQIVVAAVIGGGATAIWNWRQRRRGGGGERAARENRNVNLDIGEHVHVDAWAGDGTARCGTAGSSWASRLAPGTKAAAGEFTVTAVEGNWLVLSPRLHH